VQPGNPLGLRSIADLGRGGVRFINRQEGSGTRTRNWHAWGWSPPGSTAIRRR
jgi:hypothetical protein